MAPTPRGDAPRAAAKRRQQRADGGRREGPRARSRLDDKYVLEEGRILLTGVQALVRLRARPAPRRPRAAGCTTGTMISGYQGSPAGRARPGAVSASRALLDEHLVHHVPGPQRGARRHLGVGQPAAPARCPAPSYDGVLGMWYGKAPGLDRAADALRHGNFVGVSRTGGALAVVGDDPSCKSSTIPSASESVLASLRMPVFFPGNVPGGARPRPARLRAARARRGCGPASRSSRASPTRSAPPTSRPAASIRSCPTSATSTCPNGNLLAARLARARAQPARRPHRARPRVRPRERRQPDRGRPRRLARHRRRRQALLRPAARAAQPRARRARARARRHPGPQARHDLAARAGHDARVRAGASTRSSSSRRRAPSSRPSSRRRSTARRTRRGSSASATSRATSLLPRSSTSTPT